MLSENEEPNEEVLAVSSQVDALSTLEFTNLNFYEKPVGSMRKKVSSMFD